MKCQNLIIIQENKNSNSRVCLKTKTCTILQNLIQERKLLGGEDVCQLNAMK